VSFFTFTLYAVGLGKVFSKGSFVHPKIQNASPQITPSFDTVTILLNLLDSWEWIAPLDVPAGALYEHNPS